MLAEESDEAYAILKKAANKYVGTYMGEAAKYYMAVYWYHRKEYWKAFKAFEELMEEYPGASRTRQVVDYEFEIAKQLMTHQGFWRDWMLWRACDALEKVVEHNPSGPKAPDAQMLLGDCYMERWYWEDAYEAYNVVVESYPNSKWLSTAQFKCGLAKFREAEFTEDKRELLIQAQRAFTVYLRDSPSGAFADQARQLLSRCRYREAALKWQAAKLYERVERPRAAVATLADIARNYRETVWAGRAKERLAAYAKLGYEP
jgi:outer membrane protein assembly factor BamD (BamD/ComL family)